MVSFSGSVCSSSFHWESDKKECAVGHYGAAVSCVDGRWLPKTMELAKQVLRKQHIDFHTRPGSTRRVNHICPVTDELARSIVEVSIGLHEVQDILVVKHWDCGDHGGSKAFSCAEEEFETYISDLKRVKGILHTKISTAVAEILAVEPPEPVTTNLTQIFQRGLNLKYAILRPKDLSVYSEPNDCIPVIFS